MQLERENRQLKFERETLLYRLGQTTSEEAVNEKDQTIQEKPIRKKRSHSLSAFIKSSPSQNEQLWRSSSLNILIFR